MNKMHQLGRLAFRHEGTMWSAYYAMPDTMDEAILLGSIAIGTVARSVERREEFVQLMRNVVADIVESETGLRPVWGGLQAAPESERAGHS
jgi:hypothetical protein